MAEKMTQGQALLAVLAGGMRRKIIAYREKALISRPFWPIDTNTDHCISEIGFSLEYVRVGVIDAASGTDSTVTTVGIVVESIPAALPKFFESALTTVGISVSSVKARVIQDSDQVVTEASLAISKFNGVKTRHEAEQAQTSVSIEVIKI